MPTPDPDPLKKYLKAGYPIPSVSAGSYTTELVYVGDHNTLQLRSPGIGDTWGAYAGSADDVRLEPMAGTDPLMGELTVNMVANFESASGDGTGRAEEEVYEVDWTAVNRPLREHPVFNAGGYYELSAEDDQKLAVWDQDRTTENFNALSSNAQKYAAGILRGILTYDDFAPILSVTTGYVNGPPPTSTAGAKDEPPTDFPNKPTGYEWVKSADRSLRAGKKNRWERVQQWLGADKVLVDKNEIYY